MHTVPDLAGKFCCISGDKKLRIYFVGDESYLWYDEYGQLWAGLKNATKEERQTCEAQIAINDYGLNKQVWKPTTANFEGAAL